MRAFLTHRVRFVHNSLGASLHVYWGPLTKGIYRPGHLGLIWWRSQWKRRRWPFQVTGKERPV